MSNRDRYRHEGPPPRSRDQSQPRRQQYNEPDSVSLGGPSRSRTDPSRYQTSRSTSRTHHYDTPNDYSVDGATSRRQGQTRERSRDRYARSPSSSSSEENIRPRRIHDREPSTSGDSMSSPTPSRSYSRPRTHRSTHNRDPFDGHRSDREGDKYSRYRYYDEYIDRPSVGRSHEGRVRRDDRYDRTRSQRRDWREQYDTSEGSRCCSTNPRGRSGKSRNELDGRAPIFHRLDTTIKVLAILIELFLIIGFILNVLCIDSGYKRPEAWFQLLFLLALCVAIGLCIFDFNRQANKIQNSLTLFGTPRSRAICFLLMGLCVWPRRWPTDTTVVMYVSLAIVGNAASLLACVLGVSLLIIDSRTAG
ncbi:hypothetical protein GMRT_11261 [Giardia muris]|uniref:Uncharacterized protein n=1 Tax=Giardia muris TaxID=5742 RepID=A0A4Z1SR22_GIAMU|nr:hypothetical protein GMRT_11261 [Giardia muris]|eukprot:TNJ28322.1 hypothetical protein GMRT_11261 [Giardia muris]